MSYHFTDNIFHKSAIFLYLLVQISLLFSTVASETVLHCLQEIHKHTILVYYYNQQKTSHYIPTISRELEKKELYYSLYETFYH